MKFRLSPVVGLHDDYASADVLLSSFVAIHRFNFRYQMPSNKICKKCGKEFEQKDLKLVVIEGIGGLCGSVLLCGIISGISQCAHAPGSDQAFYFVGGALFGAAFGVILWGFIHLSELRKISVMQCPSCGDQDFVDLKSPLGEKVKTGWRES